MSFRKRNPATPNPLEQRVGISVTLGFKISCHNYNGCDGWIAKWEVSLLPGSEAAKYELAKYDYRLQEWRLTNAGDRCTITWGTSKEHALNHCKARVTRHIREFINGERLSEELEIALEV